MKGSRLQQWCYNGWWLIGMAALNCIMSVRWWDHDHGKETRQGLIFHSGELITSSHIIYCSSKISLPALHCSKPIYTWEQAKSAAMWTHIVTHLYVCLSSMLKFMFNQFVVRGWENSWLQGMTSIYSIQELILGLTWTWGNKMNPNVKTCRRSDQSLYFPEVLPYFGQSLLSQWDAGMMAIQALKLIDNSIVIICTGAALLVVTPK